MTPSPWCQVIVGFSDWSCAEDTAVAHLAPLLTSAETDGLITAWHFVRKQPCWRVRYLPTSNTPEAQDHLHARLGALRQEQHITRAVKVVFEPETHAFGGPGAMTTTHRLWHLDSRHLVAYLTATLHQPEARRRRELSILLSSTMLRAAGLDWYEQGDVWAQVADHRDAPDHLSTDEQHTFQADVRRLMSVDTGVLTCAGVSLSDGRDWITAYTTAGRELARLNAEGRLHRGLRDVLTHQIIFASNRLGLPALAQAVLATTAKTVVFGGDPAASPATGHDEAVTGSTVIAIVGDNGTQR